MFIERIESLRELMRSKNVAAVIIPHNDPHMSEYLASHWQLREWLSGFTGSAGDLVVTLNDAALWTDSRYFLQAEQQLEGSGIALMKEGLPGTPSISEWLKAKLSAGDIVGVDGMLMGAAALEALTSDLASNNIKTDCLFDPSTIWTDRPALPNGKIFIHDISYAGEGASSKIARILEATERAGAESIFISALDDIAWTLNIRCNDVEFNPVATSFLYLSPKANILLIDPAKTDDSSLAYLSANGVECRPYSEVIPFLRSLPISEHILVAPAITAGTVMEILGERAVLTNVCPAADFKSLKNDTQIAGLRNAMARDGVALVRTFMEIEDRLANNITTTELDVIEIAHRHRATGENYIDESFGTISGYAAHGAIVHYEADEESNATLRPEGLLLVDSGAQYTDGTTDITRTVCLGTASAQEKRDFTLVMKGHIALGTMTFPEGTRGAQLDAIARMFLWREGLSYMHGTGHGVGHFLCVHEGPHSIRLNYVDVPLRPGSITSNEPGLYRTDVHGIRCENLVLCQHAFTNDFGSFLKFETLTLFPFDRQLFDLDIMSAEEIKWVNDYHQEVYQRLSPALNEREKEWLKQKTQALN